MLTVNYVVKQLDAFDWPFKGRPGREFRIVWIGFKWAYCFARKKLPNVVDSNICKSVKTNEKILSHFVINSIQLSDIILALHFSIL